MDYSLEKKKNIIVSGAEPTQVSVPEKNVKTDGKKYTKEIVHELLREGYMAVHSQLWDFIPSGSHIRYIKKDVAKNTTDKFSRFKPGGFVKNHYTDPNNKKRMIIETRIGGKNGDPGYVSFPLAYEDIEDMWKKYDRNTFIETHLTHASLTLKKRQIEELENKIKRLETNQIAKDRLIEDLNNKMKRIELKLFGRN